MSNLQKISILFIIFTINCCHSTYIKTDELTVDESSNQSELTEELPTSTAVNIQEILNEIIKEDSAKVEEVKTIFAENISAPQSVEVPTSPELSSDETRPVYTGELFEIHLTLKQKWSDDFVDKKSAKFRELEKIIDTDLISFFDNQLNLENAILRGSFVLKNVLPSATDDYLYVTFIAEATENVTGQIMYEKIENWLLLYNTFYEMEVMKEGFEFKSIKNEDLKKFDKHVECNNQFCKPTPEPSPKISNLFSSQPEPSEELSELPLQLTLNDECTPNEKIKHGSTSIYIFENNQKCVENVKKRSVLSNAQNCNANSQNLENESTNLSQSDDDLIEAASEVHTQTIKAEDAKDDEVIVVVRKRGDKVFIEI